MIIVTGAAGFIGSCLVKKLNLMGFEDLHLVDDFSKTWKMGNLENKKYRMKTERSAFLSWFDQHAAEVEFVFHIGARTDTTEFNMEIFHDLNINYSKKIWQICAQHAIPMVYASSAATYGDGQFGYSDEDPELSFHLQPLNPYGVSKNEFDKWALKQQETPPNWFGMKFFNVFGPNEYHKGRMASVIFHSFNQIREKQKINLFRSHRPDYSDGGQLRDFIYVMDVVDVLTFLMQKTKESRDQHPASGLYNLGTGKARTFHDLATGVFKALGKTPEIEFIDTPLDIRDKYQYFTEAKMDKLRHAGYESHFTALEEAIDQYVNRFLEKQSNF
jgi:ADP-L-glycero-D-manno-heptose 6-epimerase